MSLMPKNLNKCTSIYEYLCIGISTLEPTINIHPTSYKNKHIAINTDTMILRGHQLPHSSCNHGNHGVPPTLSKIMQKHDKDMGGIHNKNIARTAGVRAH